MPLTPQNLLFPVKGIHEGNGYDLQPPGTASHGQNVRAYDAIAGRLRGGRRSGLSKYHPDTITQQADPIQNFAEVREALAYASTDAVTVTNGLTGATAGVGGALGAHLVAFMSVDVAGASGTTDGTPEIRAGYRYEVTATPSILMDYRTSGGTLDLDNGYMGLAVAHPTTNRLSVTQNATGQFTDVGGAANQAHGLAVGVRVSESIQSGVFAYITRTSGTTGVFRLSTGSPYSAGSGTDRVLRNIGALAASTVFTINNSASATADCVITIEEDGDEITATLVWPTQSLSITLVATTSFNQGENRAIIFGGKGSGSAGSVDITARWDIRTVNFDYLPSIARTTRTQWLGTDVPPIGVNTYTVKNGWTSATISTAGSLTTSAGYTTNASNQTYIQQNTSSTILTSTGTTGNSRFITETTAPSAERQWVMLRAPMTASIPQIGGAAYRIATDFRSAILCELEMAERVGSQTAVVDELSEWQVILLANGVRTVLYTWSTAQVSTTHKNVINSADVIVENDYPTFRVVWNGITIAEYVLTASQQLAAAGLAGNTRAGMAWRLGTSTDGMYGVRLVDAPAPGEEDAVTTETSRIGLMITAGGTISRLSNGILDVPTGGTDALSDGFGRIASQPAFGRVFYIDGTLSKHYTQSTNTVATWAATTAGTLPSECRLIALYRGRIVMAGKPTDAHNWFMSAVGDPFNWDYSPAVTSALQAVAGNNSSVGLIGDIITALIPIGDDLMLFGGDHTIYQMTGDPASGGTIDLVTDRTGVAFGKAWTKDPNGVLYFWGQDGVYRMLPGGKPESMTAGRIDRRVTDVDLTTTRVYLEWDFQRKQLVCLLVPSANSEVARVLVWESRTDAWWEDGYPVSIGPTCLYMFDSVEPEDQAFLMGGRNGYIEFIDDTAEDDDGEEIESYVRFAPLISDDDEIVIAHMDAILSKTSGDVDIATYTGQTAEECLTATSPRIRRVAHAGRNPRITQRVRGYVCQVAIEQIGSARWALESMRVYLGEGGMPRKEKAGGS